MSSNRKFLLFVALPLALSQVAHTQPRQSVSSPATNSGKPISCPPSVSVVESATPPPGWLTESATKDHLLQRISVFQKSPEGEVFDLAPDDTSLQATTVQQQWTLPHDLKLKTYLSCKYRDTGATLAFALEPQVKACTFKFVAGPHGSVAKILSVSCK